MYHELTENRFKHSIYAKPDNFCILTVNYSQFDFMIQLGKTNRLTLKVKGSQAFYFVDDENESVTVSPDDFFDDVSVGQQHDIFVYQNKEGELTGTARIPIVQNEEFGFLQVKSTTGIGAFLDWGLPKDLFVPFREQQFAMQRGNFYLVYVYVDESTGRLAASSRISRFVTQVDPEFKDGDSVEIKIWKRTDLGYNVIINNKHEGLLYQNEIYEPIHIGDSRTAYIKQIREDGKIDVVLQRQGFVAIEENAQKILDMLKLEDGFLPYHDKSKPEAVSEKFHMSKKVFKKAIGGLYRQKMIDITVDGIRLTGKE